MKKILLLQFALIANGSLLLAQKTAQQYPTPEFSNEIYFFKKDSAKIYRLEKGFSKAEMKTKMGGMGGAENAYTLEGKKSPVRLEAGYTSFIFFSGDPTTDNNPHADSAMRASGMDPSMMGDISGINDPSQTTSLYNMIAENGSRKVTLTSFQGMKILGKSKKESTKYTLSIKKVRKGYYELIVDKPLTKGEYAFVVMSGMSMSTDGSALLFAFGVD